MLEQLVEVIGMGGTNHYNEKILNNLGAVHEKDWLGR
jgi:hypothetical protein